MRDIAAAAGVAPSTVSRVLNSAPSRVPIAAETRERVLAAAARLGYRPNPLARGLRGSATMLIGAVVRDFSDPFFAAAMESLAVEAMARGYRARGKIVRVERARIPAERRRCGGGEVQVVGRLPARLAPPGVQRIDLVARQHGVVYEMAGLLGGQTCRIGGLRATHRDIRVVGVGGPDSITSQQRGRCGARVSPGVPALPHVARDLPAERQAS